MISLVILDMAGTSVNEDNIVYKTIHRVLDEKGFGITLSEVLNVASGKEKKQALRDCLQLIGANTPDEILNELYQDFSAALAQAYDTASLCPMDGMDQLRAMLRERDIILGLNTGYSRDIALRILHRLNWQAGVDYDFLVTADEVSQGRPAPDMIHLLMQQAGVQDAVEVIKVGDTVVDILEGKNAGVKYSVAMTTGAQSREVLSLSCADAIFDHLTELEKLL